MFTSRSTFDLDMLVKRAERAGMNAQLIEGVRWAYGQGFEDYMNQHPSDRFGEKTRLESASCQGWLEAKKVIRRYEWRRYKQ